MTRDQQIELAQGSFRMHAEHVARLMDVACRTRGCGRDAAGVEAKLEMFETLMWKQHRRLSALRATG